MTIKSKLPWQAKIFAKIILSRIPIGYKNWAKLGIFRHGKMDDYSYAWGVLNRHVKNLPESSKAWNALELGPGDSLLSAFLAPALGAKSITLIDSDDFANKDMHLYRQQVRNFLFSYRKYKLPDYTKCKNISEMLEVCGGTYHFEGLLSLKKLKKNSYDIIYSQAVLEHIFYDDFSSTMSECRRLLKPGGVMSHVIDFKDHLGGGLNNLRIDSVLWNKEWFALKGNFYTNRLRLSQIKRICENAGFIVKVIEINRFGNKKIKRKQLSHEFAELTDDDLSISEAHLIMY